jgi:uncharacterized protein YeaO (DUF488 family)
LLSAVEEFERHIGKSNATLLFASKDLHHNHALVLQRFLDRD